MKTINFLLFLLLTFPLCAQTLDLNQDLKDDPNLIQGKLENGLTYYVYKTQVEKDLASFYLIQNAGSILENDNQLGLAHFVEHMAFNGTKNFPGHQVQDFLESQGVLFAKDINARTTFNETIYKLNNLKTTDEVIDKTLFILSEWAQNLSLNAKDIDEERGVVIEEWRSRNNANFRALNAALETKFNGSKYAKRLPIGNLEHLKTFKYKDLRDFYNTWYRPDLQAIAVIGDVDVEKTVEKIKKQFGAIPAKKNLVKRYEIKIPEHSELLYNLHIDKELSTDYIGFIINHPRNIQDKTIANFKDVIEKKLATLILNERLNNLSKTLDNPFNVSNTNYELDNRMQYAFTINISPKINKQHESFEIVLFEIQKIIKQGVSSDELNRFIKLIQQTFAYRFQNRLIFPHEELAEEITTKFLEHTIFNDYNFLSKNLEAILSTTTPQDISEALKTLMSDKNRKLIINSLTKENNLTKEEAQDILQRISKKEFDKIKTDKEEELKFLNKDTLTKGKIISKENIKELNAIKYVLSNGVNVYFKYSEATNDLILFKAKSEGGISKLKDNQALYASQALELTNRSGLGALSREELTKLKQDLYVNQNNLLSLSISDLEETMQGIVPNKNLEAYLQFVHLKFGNPKFDKDAFQFLKNGYQEYFTKSRTDLKFKINDSLSTAIYGKQKRKFLFTQNYVDNLNFNNLKSIYLDRFGNPSDFNFLIVGKYQPEDLEPLLETYIGSLKTTSKIEKWNKDNTLLWINNNIDKTFYFEMTNPIGILKIDMEKDKTYSLKGDYTASILSNVLQVSLTQKIREEFSSSYSPEGQVKLIEKPHPLVALSLTIECDPNKLEAIKVLTQDVLDQIVKGNFENEIIKNSITNLVAERKKTKQSIYFDILQLDQYISDGINIADPKYFDDIISEITKEDVVTLAKELIKSPTRKSVLAIMPKS